MKHPAAQRALERLFFEGLTPTKEEALRAHLADCASCQSRYERYALLAPFDRKMLSAEDRLAPGLGLSKTRPRAAGRFWGPIGLGLACAAVALLLVLGKGSSTAAPTFASRGETQEPQFGLWIFRTGPAATGSQATGSAATAPAPSLLAQEMRQDDEIAFAYVNPTSKPYLAIYASDEHGHVYWYHPGWRAGEPPPKSIPTVRGMKLQELKESIRHDFDGRHVVISAVLSEHPLDVQAVEATLARGAPLTTLDATVVIAAKREVEIGP